MINLPENYMTISEALAIVRERFQRPEYSRPSLQYHCRVGNLKAQYVGTQDVGQYYIDPDALETWIRTRTDENKMNLTALIRDLTEIHNLIEADPEAAQEQLRVTIHELEIIEKRKKEKQL